MEDYQHEPVSEKELPALAAEVLADYESFRASATVLVRTTGQLNPILRRVFVESLNLHARSLTDWFGREPRRDDVAATHFASDWNVEADGHTDVIWLRTAVLPGVHKRLAHLTVYRTRVPADWDAQPVIEIAGAVSSLMPRFLAVLPPARRALFERDGQSPDLQWCFRDLLGLEDASGALDALLGIRRRWQEPADGALA